MPTLRRLPLPRSFFTTPAASRTALPCLTQSRHLVSQPQPAAQQQPPQPSLQLHYRRAFSTSTPQPAADHGSAEHESDQGHESHYDEPGGWLWGIRPGEKYEYEGWEYIMWYGFTGSWIVAIIAIVNKEDTSIQTWALEEARRRLEKEGILEDPFPDHVEPVDEPK